MNKIDYKFPEFIGIQFTQRCNLRCKMCFQWGPQGYFLNKKFNLFREEVKAEKWNKFFDEISEYKPTVVFWGGEPLLYRDIRKIMKHLHAKELKSAIITNGTLLEEYAQDIVSSVYRIAVSLDGPEKINDNIRGRGVFSKVMKGLRKIEKIKKECKSQFPQLQFLYTITNKNYKSKYIIDFFNYIKDNFDAHSFFFEIAWFHTPQMRKQYKQQMKTLLGCKATSCDGWISTNHINIEPKEVEKAFCKIEKNKGNSRLILLDCMRDVKKFLEEPTYTFGYTECAAVKERIGILPNGDAILCTDYPDYIIGNVFTQNILEIWYGKRAEKFRNLLRKRGLFAICSRCSSLYGYAEDYLSKRSARRG